MRGVSTLFIILLVVVGFGALLWLNADDDAPGVAVIPTQVEASPVPNVLPTILREGFGEQSTPLPTVAVPIEQYEAPTLIPNNNPSPTPFSAVEFGSDELFTLAPAIAGLTPTLPPPTPVVGTAEDDALAVQDVPTNEVVWNPPPLDVPLSRDPLGRDHYWFLRPIDSNATNSALRSYTYGADGTQLRIHHGLDFSNNQVGQTVRAVGNGTIYFASSEERPFYQNTSSYGNVVVIEHDIGLNGQVIYTLYAHMEQVFVQTGNPVQAGDAIGLVGQTGSATGPHLHFEVRVGGDRYGDTVNPILWVAPYVDHGTIVGTLTNDRERLLDDVLVTLIDSRTGLTYATTTTYIFDGTVNQVNSDPNYGENFAFGDIPAGNYRLVVRYEGLNITRNVRVFEGMTTFVELEPIIPATAQPVTPEPEDS